MNRSTRAPGRLPQGPQEEHPIRVGAESGGVAIAASHDVGKGAGVLDAQTASHAVSFVPPGQEMATGPYEARSRPLAASISALVVSAAVTLLLQFEAPGAIDYWDADTTRAGNDTSSGSGLGGSGGWLTFQAWWNGAAGIDTNFVSGSDAVFTGTAGRVQLNGANNSTVSAGVLTFGVPGYIIDLASSNGDAAAESNLTITGLSGANATIYNSSTFLAIRTLTINLAADTTWGGTIGAGGNGRLGVTLNTTKTLNLTGPLVIAANFGQPTLSVQGGGRLNLVGNTLSSAVGSLVSITGGSTFDIGGNQYSARQWTLDSASTITSSGTGRIIANDQNSDLNFQGVLAGSLGVDLNAGGRTLTLANSGNTYSGGTRVFNGTLIVASDAALGTEALSFGSTSNPRLTMGFQSTSSGGLTITKGVSFSGNDRTGFIFGSSTTGDLVFTSASVPLLGSIHEFDVQNANTTFQGALSGGTALKKTDLGNLLLSNGNSSFSGGLTIAKGLSVGAFVTPGTVIANDIKDAGVNSSIGAGSNVISATAFPITTIADGGTLKYAPIGGTGGGATSTDRLFAIGPNGGTIDASGTGALVFSNTGLQTPERAAAVTTAAMALGGTTLRIAGATLSRLLVGMTVSGSGVAPGTTIADINTSNTTVALNKPLSDNIAANASINFGYGNRTLTLAGTNTDNNTIAGVLQDSVTGGGVLSVAKTGVGKWVLSGANTYTGATTVTGGTLEISGSLSGVSASQITIDNGSTLLLSASNALNNPGTGVLLGGTSGRLKLSDSLSSATETLGALTLSASSTIDFGAGAGDSLLFAGLGTHTGGAVLTIANWSGNFGTAGTTGVHDRFIFNGQSPAFQSAFGQNEVFFTGFGAGYAAIQFSGTQYEIVAVPEPSRIGLLGACALVGLARFRHWRRRVCTLDRGSRV